MPKPATWANVLRRDPCAYCGRPFGGRRRAQITVDHITPKAAGGDNSPENLTAACKHCNVDKDTTSLLLFLIDRPDRSEWPKNV